MAQQFRIGKYATSVREENGFTMVCYHSTDVVKFNNHKAILNSGGWKTQTTKNRMNQTFNQFRLPFRVFQKDFEWYVKDRRTGEVIDYKDGMEINI